MSLLRVQPPEHCGGVNRETAYKRGNRHLLANETTKAIRCYQLAADAGHTGAQYNLGLMYLKGEGIAPDVLRGLEWITKAAESGDRQAQGLLQKVDRAVIGE